MQTLEIRRHSMRKHTGGSQLSQEGVTFARRIGASLGPFAQVVTSIVPRARETAIAMGFAVDYELVTLVSDQEVYQEAGAVRWWESPQPFAAVAPVLATKGVTWRYATSIVALWRDMLTPLPDGTNALFIGHSGELEVVLVACFPHSDHASWGAAFGPLQGARLTFGGDLAHFVGLELIRY